MPKARTKDILVNSTILAVAIGSLYIATKVWGGDEMKAWIESAGIWAPLAIIAAKASTLVFAPLNGSIIYPISGGLFGFWKGFMLVLLGDTLGATISFWISRRFGRSVVERFIGNETGLVNQLLSTMGTVRGFLITRVALFTAQDILAYAAGLTRLPYLSFIAIHMAVGSIPAAILTAFGATLLEQGFGGLGYIFIGTAAAAMLSITGFLWYQSKIQSEKTSDSSEN